MSLRVKKQIAYWKATAEHDWQTVQTLWRTKRHDGCLFFCHLVIEKILKAVVVKITQQDAPRIHDLVRLANSAELALTESQQDMLAKINHFNLIIPRGLAAG